MIINSIQSTKKELASIQYSLMLVILINKQSLIMKDTLKKYVLTY